MNRDYDEGCTRYHAVGQRSAGARALGAGSFDTGAPGAAGQDRAVSRDRHAEQGDCSRTTLRRQNRLPVARPFRAPGRGRHRERCPAWRPAHREVRCSHPADYSHDPARSAAASTPLEHALARSGLGNFARQRAESLEGSRADSQSAITSGRMINSHQGESRLASNRGVCRP